MSGPGERANEAKRPALRRTGFRRHPVLTALAVGFVLASVVRSASFAKTPGSIQRPSGAAPAAASDRPLGSPSCSTAACHGSLTEDPQPTAIRGDEFHVWLEDPHARAYAVLFEPRSRKMFENLGVADANLVPLAGREAAFDRYWQGCLACHGPGDQTDGVEVADRGASLTEGVSCEGCHGNAGKWIHVHYRPEWKTLTLQDKTDLGFLDTADHVARARVCSSCHVGGAGRDVNHDLIAAGHPGMKFDMSWYQTLVPSHWKDQRQASADSSVTPSPLRDWLVGQLVGASSALRQLERRAAARDDVRIWPELSEYSCFACHHDLESDSWRQQRGFWQPASLTFAPQKDSAVQLPWGNWTLESLGAIAEAFDSAESKAFVTSFGAVSKTLSSGLRASSDQAQAEARTAADDLDRWVESLRNASDAEVRQALRKTAQGEWPVATWDRAAIMVLGLGSAYRSQPESAPESIRDLMSRVRFSKDNESVFDSPIRFRGPVATNGRQPTEKIGERERIRRLIEELLKAD